MRLLWQATMNDGSVVREIENHDDPARVAFIHVDQDEMKSLEIVDVNGKVIYRTFAKPVHRCHHVLDHRSGEEVHRVESGTGADFELAICDELDGKVTILKAHGKDVRTRALDWAPLDSLKAKYPTTEAMRAAKASGEYSLAPLPVVPRSKKG